MCEVITNRNRIRSGLPNIGLVVLDIAGLERPYQIYLCQKNENSANFVVRGSTTDKLIAKGKISMNSKDIEFKFEGKSDWHAALAKGLEQMNAAMKERLWDTMNKSIKYGSRKHVLLDSYKNVGHALQNEIGPLLKVNEKNSLEEYIFSNGSDHTNYMST